MRGNLVEQVISDVMNKQTDISPEAKTAANFAGCGITGFIGTALGYTIDLVIANIDNRLHEVMNIDKRCRSIGILDTRTDAGPQIFAADEAVKATNSEIISIELARDTEGGGGHDYLIIFSASDASDIRRAVEVALPEIEHTMGDVYGPSAGHFESQYTIRASYALNRALGVPIGKSFGVACTSPAAIGLVIADTAAKSAVIDPVGHASPSRGTSSSNEVIFTFSGDSGAARQAVIVVCEVGLQLLPALDSMEVESTTTPYIQTPDNNMRDAIGG